MQLNAFAFILILLCCVLSTSVEARPHRQAWPFAVYARTAFLGDSITDGDTYPQLVRDSLIAAGQPALVDINAGMGGDTIRGMKERLNRDVLVYSPNLVTISAGANDSHRDVAPDDYEADLRDMVRRLRAKNTMVLLMTPCILGPSKIKENVLLKSYERGVRRIAKEFGLRIAEVNHRQSIAVHAGRVVLSTDEVHPNNEGQRLIARAILDAMGFPDVKVLEYIRPSLALGIIEDWKMRACAPGEARLTAATLPQVAVDETWKMLSLPQPPLDLTPQTRPGWQWLEDFRSRGTAVQLDRCVSPGERFIGSTQINADSERTVRLDLGADLQTVWLNGKEIYGDAGGHGWHLGSASALATFHAGENQLVIETGKSFFLSIAPDIVGETPPDFFTLNTPSVLRCALPEFDSNNWESVEKAFSQAPTLTFRQSWRPISQANYLPAYGKIGTNGERLWVYAELRDADAFNPSRGLNKEAYLVGDVLEIFVQPSGTSTYYEIHVTPENQLLQVAWPFIMGSPNEKGEPELGRLCSDFLSQSTTRIEQEKGLWRVLIAINANDLISSRPKNGETWRISLARYDYTRGVEKPVLSSSSPHRTVSFHQPNDWSRLVWVR